MDTNGLRHRYLLIGHDQYGDWDGQGVTHQTEALRIVADNDYPYMTWVELLDGKETNDELRLITGPAFERLVQEYKDSRAADERHERSLGVTG